MNTRRLESRRAEDVRDRLRPLGFGVLTRTMTSEARFDEIDAALAQAVPA